MKAVPHFSPGEAEKQRIRVLLDDIRLGPCPAMGPACSERVVAWPVASEDCSRTTLIRL